MASELKSLVAFSGGGCTDIKSADETRLPFVWGDTGNDREPSLLCIGGDLAKRSDDDLA